MTFLILKIAAYLFVALLLGSAAGWVSRHVAATREIDSLSKQLNENRAKVPQLETLIRVRDDELARLRKDRDASDGDTKQALAAQQAQQQAVRDKDIEIARLTAQLTNLQSLSNGLDDDSTLLVPAQAMTEPAQVADESSIDPQLLTEYEQKVVTLSERIEILEGELLDCQHQLSLAQQDSGLSSEVTELTNRLRQKAQDFDRLNRQLDAERRKVSELERERELQNKSLQVLHQQLEMERTGQEVSESTT